MTEPGHTGDTGDIVLASSCSAHGERPLFLGGFGCAEVCEGRSLWLCCRLAVCEGKPSPGPQQSWPRVTAAALVAPGLPAAGAAGLALRRQPGALAEPGSLGMSAGSPSWDGGQGAPALPPP